MYALGKTLRKRYGRLLPSDGIYTAEKMHVMSSALERTQMSGQSLLAGLMPPLSDRNALPIQWQPVPIHSIPKQVDNVYKRPSNWKLDKNDFIDFHLQLIAQGAPCPKFDEIHAEILKNPPSELQRIYQENAELYSYLTENSGLVSATFYDISNRSNNVFRIIFASIRTRHFPRLLENCGTLYSYNTLIICHYQHGLYLYSPIGCVRSQNWYLHCTRTPNTCNLLKVVHWSRKSPIKCWKARVAGHQEQSTCIPDMISHCWV